MELSYYSHSVQIIGFIFGLLMLFSIFFLVKAKKIKEKYSIIWFFIAIFVLVISIFKGFMEWFSNFIGIYYAPSAFFSILITCSYLLLMNMSISISTLRRQNKNLIQEVGLLKLKVEEMEEKLVRSDEK